jgi:lipopolysaccharide export system protein LptA
MTLVGNVVLTQGQNVVRGDRLWVDMNTGVYEVKSKGGQGRVDAVFQPGSMKENMRPGGQGNAAATAPRNAAPAQAGAPASQGGRAQGGASDKDKSRQQPARPLKLN